MSETLEHGTCCLQREFIGLLGPRLSDLTCNPTVSKSTRTVIGWERVRPAPDWLLSVVGLAARQLNGRNNLQLSVSAGPPQISSSILPRRNLLVT